MREAALAKVIWSMGVGALALALLVALWPHHPVEPPRAEPEPEAPSSEGPRVTELAPAPLPAREPVELPRPEPSVAEAPPAAEAPRTAAAPWPLSAHARRKLPEQRLRLVRALRADHPTPLARRDAVLAEFQASGESDAPWTTRARAALETWRATIDAEVLPIRAEPPRCYAAGCVTRVTFPDEASQEEARQRVPHQRLGEVAYMQLPAERLPTGEVVVSWAVLSPANP